MPSPGTTKKVLLGNASRITYDADALAYFTRAGIYDPTEQLAVNTLFTTLKATPAIWASLSLGYLYLVSPTNLSASLFNAMSDNFTLTAGAYPNFSTNGWSFNGQTHYLNTNFNCSTNLTLNTGFQYFYSRTNAQSAGIVMGAVTSTQQWQCQSRNTSDLARFGAYNAATIMTAANTDASGHFVFNISASNSRYIRRNGVSLGTSAATVGGSLPSHNMYIGARNNTGTADAFTAYEITSAACGTVALSTTNADIFTTAMAAYNAAVIPGGR